MLLTVISSNPTTLVESLQSPWVVAAVVVGIALVALFVRVQSLAKQLADLKRSATRPSTAPSTPVSSGPPSAHPAVDGRLLAVITAAAVASLGRRVLVKRITFINQNTVSGWAEAGRISIHSSHNVRRN